MCLEFKMWRSNKTNKLWRTLSQIYKLWRTLERIKLDKIHTTRSLFWLLLFVFLCFLFFRFSIGLLLGFIGSIIYLRCVFSFSFPRFFCRLSIFFSIILFFVCFWCSIFLPIIFSVSSFCDLLWIVVWVNTSYRCKSV